MNTATRCTACGQESTRHPDGDGCHACGRGVMRALPACPDCRGTGRAPLSDNVNWLPCSRCGGRGHA